MIIDSHTHILPPHIKTNLDAYLHKDTTLRTLFAQRGTSIATAEQLVAAMDEAGVDAAVALGMGWTSLEVAREVNDYLLESAERFPNRIAPFCSVSPAWGEPALREVERCAKLGARGVGELHPDTQGYNLADQALMKPLMKLVASLGIAILTHASEPVGHQYPGKGTTTPEVLMTFIKQHPDVTIVCAHWGGGLPFYALMPEVHQGLKRIYFDTSVSPFLYDQQIFSLAPQVIGADAILMGSDYPLLKPQRVIDQVNASSLTDDQKAAVLGGNAQRLLGLS